jgi:hypothetical protein
MDTPRPSAASFIWIDLIGPFADHDEFVAALGPRHPYLVTDQETLHWYDGPVITVGTVEGDPRPRLDILVSDDHVGEEGRRIFTSVRHQLVFDRRETLDATLAEYDVPTQQSYAMADEIIRYATRSTQIGHPEQSHSAITAAMALEDVPTQELPDRGTPVGLKCPTAHEERNT